MTVHCVVCQKPIVHAVVVNPYDAPRHTYCMMPAEDLEEPGQPEWLATISSVLGTMATDENLTLEQMRELARGCLQVIDAVCT